MVFIIRSEDEVKMLEKWAFQSFTTGESHYPGMTYEDGVRETLAWLLGESEKSPADD